MATKKEVTKVVRELTKKAQSFGQVCKQLSGIRGKIRLTDSKTCTVKEAFALLDVRLENNKITPNDIAKAWAEPLKEAHPMHVGGDETARTFSGWRAPLIMKDKPVVIEMAFKGDEPYRLYEKDSQTGEYKPVRQKVLCRLVKAEDRRKGSTDVVVSAQNVLKGLAQSAFVFDTFNELKASEEAVAKITNAWVNVGTTSRPQWREVTKDEDGIWDFVVALE